MLSEHRQGKGVRPPRPATPVADRGLSHRVTLLPGGETFAASPDEDILTAALRHGIQVMYGCRHGNCGTCQHYLVDGDVAEGRTSPYVLTSEARQRGAVLLCSSFAHSDVVVERPEVETRLDDGEVIPPEVRLAAVTAVSTLSPSLVELRLHLEEPLPFRAGQYVEIWLPGTDHRRSLSIASPPRSAHELTFLLSVRSGGRLARVVERLRPGGVLRLQGPFGHFHFRPSGRPAVMVALGAGIAPVLSILRDAAERGSPPAVTLYYGGRDDERAYVDELERFAATHPGFTLHLAPPPVIGGTATWALTQLVACELRDGSAHDAYVSGLPQMCDALSALLAAKGTPERHIRVEKFYPAERPG